MLDRQQMLSRRKWTAVRRWHNVSMLLYSIVSTQELLQSETNSVRSIYRLALRYLRQGYWCDAVAV